MSFKEIFDRTDSTIKSNFLYKLLEKDSSLREEFINSIDEIPSGDVKHIIDFKQFLEEITGLYDNYKSDMESLELEDTDWENYVPRHSGYIADWEASQHMAEDEADNLFSFFHETISSLLLQDRIEDLLVELISFYYSAKDAEIEDPYCNLGDLANEYFLAKLNEYLDYSKNKIAITKIADERITNSIGLFFKYFELEQKENYDDIKKFEELLVLLVDKIDSTESLMSLNKITSIDNKYCPLLSVSIEEKLGNSNEWIEQAHKNMYNDTKIGIKLLNYYSDTDIQKFYAVANNLFKNNKAYWAKTLQDKIDLKIDKNLFIKIYYQLAISERKIEYYNRIKDFLTEEEYNKLLEEIKYDLCYLVEIFESDKKYPDIKQVVEKNTDSWDYEKLISPILNVYPFFSFENIRDKVLKSIANERGRNAYMRIASLMKLAKKIPGYETQTQKLILQLYNNKPNLPALKDEFRSAKLVENSRIINCN